jgi:hypothetical protein
MNYNSKINLLRLRNAFATNIKGKTETKRCVCIPIDDNDLFVGEKGIYLDAACYELKNPTDNQSHLIKLSVPKEKFDAMNETQRQAIPIIGNLSQFASLPISGTTEAENDDDLPF